MEFVDKPACLFIVPVLIYSKLNNKKGDENGLLPSELYVGPRIKRISNAMARKRTLDLEDMDLTSSQGMVLGYLNRRQTEAVYPGDIGRHFGMSQPTVTGILQRLETKGFLTYEADENDRRKKRVRLTERALECHQQILRRFLETEALLTRGLSPEEQTLLLRLLDRMIESMDAGWEACCPKEEPHD